MIFPSDPSLSSSVLAPNREDGLKAFSKLNFHAFDSKS